MKQFRSNNGRGHYLAQLILVKDGIAIMKMWKEGGKRFDFFTLPERFLSSPSCGWKTVN